MRYYMIFFFFVASLAAQVRVGLENLFDPPYVQMLKGKRIGLLTNHTAITKDLKSSIDVIKEGQSKYGYTLAALFAPEHGLNGAGHAWEYILDRKLDNIPVFSLHGKTRRPTPEMLKNIDLLIYDIQDIGSRSYTYISTLFYAMEEAAKADIAVMVLDRPNPINGLVVDGPLMEEKWRSIVGYINVPYIHGMTVAELARFFNEEYHVGCQLIMVPMSGWKRAMTFADTGLSWIPTSPHVPEPQTTYYYPMTGILGELGIVNIGVGYTLPFKCVGAPWINSRQLADTLNAQKLKGVIFYPFSYKPFYGKFVNEECEGVLLMVVDPGIFEPVTSQYVLMGILKSLYPKQFMEAFKEQHKRREMFAKVNGTDRIYELLETKRYAAWELRQFQQREREEFLAKRKRYLLSSY